MTSRFPRHRRDELHEKGEVIVRSIVKVDGQTKDFLVEGELEVTLGT